MITSLKSLYSRILASMVHAIARTGVHPNTLTVVSLFPALAAGWAAANGQFVAAAFLLLSSGVFDLLDGALARATNQESKFGALLDSTLDRLSDAAVPAGMVLFYAPHGAVLLVPLAMIISGFSISYIRARAEGLAIDLPRLWLRREDRMAILVIGLLLSPLPGMTIPAGATVFVGAILAALGFAAAGVALLTAARRSR